VNATDVVWLSPLLVCALTVTLTVVLLEEVGPLEAKVECLQQAMALLPIPAIAMSSMDSESVQRRLFRICFASMDHANVVVGELSMSAGQVHFRHVAACAV
jgi:hypothetical protein